MPERKPFHTLDGLRGIAALLVMTRHSSNLDLGSHFPETYLAVDLFFLLSGFVIAFAYDERLKQRNFVGKFLLIRLVRLYPLYLLGLSLGFLHEIGSIVQHRAGHSVHHLLLEGVLGMLLLSSALDGPTWTLLPELIANMVYALLFRWLSRTVLNFMVVLGAVGVIVCRLHYGTLDAGWSITQLPTIASRLLFSFFGGVLLFRCVGTHRRSSPVVASLCVVSVGGLLMVTPPADWMALYEIALVLVVFPVVVWAACKNEPGKATGKLFAFLGLISYAVYVLHQPTAEFLTYALKAKAHLDLSNAAAAHRALYTLMALLVVACWLIDRYYDTPVRSLLSRRLGLRSRA